MFSVRVFEYSQKNERVKQNKLNLHFGFWVFSCLVAVTADKYSLEMVRRRKWHIDIFSFLHTQSIKFKRQQFSAA